MTLALTESTIILDASCLINLFATEREREILSAIPQNVTVAAYVHDYELLFVRKLLEEEYEKELIDLDALIEQSLIEIVDLSDDAEYDLYIRLAQQIRDEGESFSAAIAINRKWAIAIDDRRARNVIDGVSGGITQIYSLDLIKHWCDSENLNQAEISHILSLLRKQGSYIPHKTHPLLDWWNQNI